MSLATQTRRCYVSVLVAMLGLLATAGPAWAADLPAPGPAAETTPQQREELQKRFAVKQWHVQVRVQVAGGGHKENPGERSRASYSVNRLAEYKFTVQTSPGELAALTATEQMLKKFPNPDVAKAYEQMSTHRRWQPDQKAMMKADTTGEVNFVIADRDGFQGQEAIEAGDLIPGGAPRFSHQSSLAGAKAGGMFILAAVSMDFKKGTYDIQLMTPDTVEAVETYTSSDPKQNKTAKRRMSATGADLRIRDQPLPKDGGILSGHLPIPKEGLDRMRHGYDYGRVSGVIEWTATPEPLPDVLLLLSAEKYDDWLPRGGKSESEAGNTIKVNARLKARNGPLGEAKIKAIRFQLDEVSREPGVCLNLPLDKGAETPDLKFEQAGNAGYTIGDDGSRARKKGECTDANVVVTAFDWGAYGELTAVAELTDGRLLYGKVEDTLLEEVLRLPKRDPDSHIGDKWKKDMEATHVSDDDDSERTTGNKHDGDGLTAYEEYRGLIAQGKHTRDHPAGRDGHKPLSPARKDLIVHNTIKGQYASAATAGLDLFEKASSIHVVELDDGEMPDSRQVNVNRKTASAGEQYGLLLANEASQEAGTVGLSTSVDFKRGQEKVGPSPKYWIKIAADIAQIKGNHSIQADLARKGGVKMPYTAENDIAVTIAHEMGHGVGARHHGLEPGSKNGYTITDKMKDWKAYEADGAEITARPFTPQRGVGTLHCESSGDVDCIMCYPNAYNWVAQSVGAYGPPLIYYKAPLLPNGKTFCTSPKGTGTNAPHTLANGKALPGLFGNAGTDRGNCLGMLKVKDQ